MGKSTVSVPISARPALTPPKGVTAKTPTVVINTSTQPRSPRRWAFRHPDRLEIGGGALLPKIKCSRKDIGVAVLAIGAAAALVYGAKSVHEYFKNLWTRKAEESQVPIPEPPKVEAVINCVNSVGKPKEPLVPDMVYERSISVIAGRPNGGKTLLAQQLAIELARGDGELVGEDVPPQNVIIVDGEMDDDDYKRRFGGEDMVVPSNITRISDCDFSTLKQLTSYLKKLVDGLLGPAVIIIDNIASLTLETLTGKIVNEFFRDLKRIQRGTENAITFIIADHIGKTPVGQPLDDSNIAGSANVARFAHTIVFVDFSARGSDYRFIKFSKLRKGALPDEVLEVHISEEEYVHFEVIGHASEAEVIRTKSNLKRFGQEIKDVVDEEEDTPEEDPKIAEAREMKAFLETHTQDETAQHFNCSRQTVVNRMKLLVERNEG